MNNLLQNASGYAAAFKAADITSEPMRRAIKEWFDLYFQDNPTSKEDPCQRIPYTIVSKLTKTVFSEYTTTTQNDFAKSILWALDNRAGTAMQMALIGGECALKPVPVADGFRFMVVPRNNILVFARDAEGNMTDIGTTEITTSGNHYFTLLERRTVDSRGFLQIRYKLFKSYSKETLGQQVPLSSLPQYEALQEEYVFTKPVGSIGLISLRTPMVNCVDGSSDAVSVYAAATGLIHNINHNEYQLCGEFDRGESRIAVSADVLKFKDGEKVLESNLFVGLDDVPETIGFNIFAPTLREASFLARKQEYLRNVENIIGLKRGLLSEVEAAERTATEITSSAGDYNLTIIDFQKMWERAVREAVRVCAILGDLYKVSGAQDIPENAVTINWGNGVLYDEEKTWEDYKAMVAAGLLKPEIAVGWRFNMPTETEADLATVRQKYMPGVDGMLDDIDSEDENLPKVDKPSKDSTDVKTLNGAQTQSLLSVIAQYQAGQLSIGQAINVLSVAIGVDKEKARKIIEGALE